MLLKAVSAFLLLPGVFAFLIPWAISTFDPWSRMLWKPGLAVLGIGVVILLYCVRDFYLSGKGTLAPWSPPQYLVTVGLYRYSRNPMFFGVLLIISGWALTYCSPLITLYLVFATCIFHWRVTHYEEVVLSEQFPSLWAEYAENVPRWLIKLESGKKIFPKNS